MNILVTGAGGFVGKNLCASLHNLRDGKDRSRPTLAIGEVMQCHRDTPQQVLDACCARADFVFHLAGVNRGEHDEAFMQGNPGSLQTVLEGLKRHGNACPVMLASSVQATRLGRYDNAYGASKKAAEELLFRYADKSGAKVLVYRFPNVFGKWCKPNYNSVVATFCHSIARERPIRVDDPATELELCYIDDLVAEMLDALQGREHWDGRFCCVPVTYRVTLGQIAEWLERFHALPQTKLLPAAPEHSFERKLYSTYLSYLPAEKLCFPLKTNADARGSFTELLKTAEHGQLSVNVIKPGQTKGQHWHHSKWELFIVVSGHGLIRQRRLETEEVLEFEVSGSAPQTVQMLPGYTHSITNLSRTEALVTVMWANEIFDPEHPDTYFEEV